MDNTDLLFKMIETIQQTTERTATEVHEIHKSIGDIKVGQERNDGAVKQLNERFTMEIKTLSDRVKTLEEEKKETKQTKTSWWQIIVAGLIGALLPKLSQLISIFK